MGTAGFHTSTSVPRVLNVTRPQYKYNINTRQTHTNTRYHDYDRMVHVYYVSQLYIKCHQVTYQASRSLRLILLQAHENLRVFGFKSFFFRSVYCDYLVVCHGVPIFPRTVTDFERFCLIFRRFRHVPTYSKVVYKVF